MKVLVLSGGGAKGAYQLGCIEGLVARGHYWDAIVGISVGALNAAGMAFLDIERMKDVWFSIKSPKDIIAQNFILTLPWKKGVYSIAPLEKLLKNTFRLEVMFPKMDAYAGYVDLASSKVNYQMLGQSTQENIKAILASSAMPVIMEPVGMLVDGGVRDIVPLKYAIKELKADQITVISCSPYSREISQNWRMRSPKIIKTLVRTIDIMASEIMWTDLELCKARNADPRFRSVSVEIYAPDHAPVLDALDFEPDLIKQAYSRGLKMAEGPIIEF